MVLRMMSRCNTDSRRGGGGRSDPVTMDLLGGGRVGGGVGSNSKDEGEEEEDVNRRVPAGWEKSFHLSAGEGSRNSSSLGGGCSRLNPGHSHRRVQDLNCNPIPFQTSNFPPTPPPNLDLKLFSPSMEYQSVCTLDKVKIALERIKKPIPNPNPSSSPTSSSTTTSSTRQLKRSRDDADDEVGLVETSSGVGKRLLQAAGCPNCLSYVLVSKGNPRCPRCNSAVPFPVLQKPRLDLNLFHNHNNPSSASALAEIS